MPRFSWPVARVFVPGSLLVSLVFGGSLGCGTTSTGSDAHPRSANEGSDSPSSGRSGGQVGAPIPSIVLERLVERSVDRLDGNQAGARRLDLGALRGKVYLVDVWASWCGPCQEELPLLDDLAARLKDHGVEIIAISIDEERQSVAAFLGRRSTWSLTVALDPNGLVPEALHPAKMPTSYVVDGRGIIRYVNAGFERGDVTKLEARLRELAATSS
jgi:thiol-disulfide isomerase/thioredoxin